MFWLPAGIFFAQFLLLLWLEKHHDAVLAATPEPPKEKHHAPESSALNQPVSPRTFLKMAWLANPFAYVAINTLFAVMPGVAEKLALSPTRVGLVLFRLVVRPARARSRCCGNGAAGITVSAGCSRRSLVLIAGLAAILLAQQLWLVVVAQIFFGLATGLIYYSSLFYAMDVGEASSEHGGLHEAFIGAGIFLGPATGAAALTLRAAIRQCRDLGRVGLARARPRRIAGDTENGEMILSSKLQAPSSREIPNTKFQIV